ncbi:MAG: SIS domain-containing protein [Clostridia bacterium]|nr:SIS domain-containing protein [Clostridia bacterium]
MINELIKRYPQLDSCKKDIISAADMLCASFNNGGKLLLCGNGGSSADCEHISGELMKGFLKLRPLNEAKKASMLDKCPDIDSKILDKLQSALPAIPLPSLCALNTAFSNDVEPSLVYAQALLALAKERDALVAISTSGNSANVLNAAKLARALGVKVISLTGESGGALRDASDICIRVPESETYKVQELHLPVYHYLCAEIENRFFGYTE